MVLDSVTLDEEEAAQLNTMVQDPRLAKRSFLFYANKQDAKGAQNVQQVVERLKLFDLRNRQWYIQGRRHACCLLLLC